MQSFRNTQFLSFNCTRWQAVLLRPNWDVNHPLSKCSHAVCAAHLVSTEQHLSHQIGLSVSPCCVYLIRPQSARGVVLATWIRQREALK